MDFKIYTNTRFITGVDILSRLYQATELRDGRVQIRHVRTGEILATLPVSEITVEGEPLQSLADLQNVIYNVECECDPDRDDSDLRIFDMSFDPTFE